MTGFIFWLIGWGITEGITGETGFSVGIYWPTLLGKWIKNQIEGD